MTDQFKNKAKQTVVYTTSALGITAVLVIGLLSTGAIDTSAFRGSQNLSDEARVALESNDLDAFKVAISENASERKLERIESIDEEKFEEIQVRVEASDAITAAIEAENYDAFETALASAPEKLSEKLSEKVDSEEAFADFVATRKASEEVKTAFEDAIKANDFEAFQTAVEAGQELRVANGKEARDIDAEKLQEKFDSAVANYEETGEIQSGRGGKGIRGAKGRR